MQEAIRFIKDNFKQVSVLKERNGGMTEIVIDAENAIYIRKTIPYIGLPYRKLMKLPHPLLPKVYYAAEMEGRTCVIEQYVDGRNLQDILDREGALPEETVRRVGLQLCDALEFLHGQGIIHRDIKPSNIIMKEDGALCLIDFGAARVIKEDAEQDTRILGTPGFAPPEQYGFAATDYRSDFYALGMTLRALLGNEYRGSLTEAIRRCVELDPERRVSSARELRSLLQAHWYDIITGNKYAAALILCVLIGGAAWWLSTSNKTATEIAALPSTTVVTQEKDNKSQQQPAVKQNEKEKAETKVSSSDGAVQSQKVSIDNNTQQPKEILSKNKIETQPVTTPKPITTPKPVEIQFSGSNWGSFQKTEQHLGPKVPNADKVIHPAGQWPQVMVTNNSDTELKNPKVELYFTDFGVMGSDFSAGAWGGRKETTTFAGKTSNGVATKVTLRLDGTLPPHDERPLSLFGGVSGFYRTGVNPNVRIVFSADNAPAQEKSYTIGVK